MFPYGFAPGQIRAVTLTLSLADGTKFTTETTVTLWAVQAGAPIAPGTGHTPLVLLVTFPPASEPQWIRLDSAGRWYTDVQRGEVGRVVGSYVADSPECNSLEIMARTMRERAELLAAADSEPAVSAATSQTDTGHPVTRSAYVDLDDTTWAYEGAQVAIIHGSETLDAWPQYTTVTRVTGRDFVTAAGVRFRRDSAARFGGPAVKLTPRGGRSRDVKHLVRLDNANLAQLLGKTTVTVEVRAVAAAGGEAGAVDIEELSAVDILPLADKCELSAADLGAAPGSEYTVTVTDQHGQVWDTHTVVAN